MLRSELTLDKKNIEERIAKIDKLLNQGTVHLDQDSFESPTFQKMAAILDADQINKYAQTCPEIYNQHQKLYGIRTGTLTWHTVLHNPRLFHTLRDVLSKTRPGSENYPGNARSIGNHPDTGRPGFIGRYF
ncbi:hypothetical protein [Desulfosporosinus sp. OT]|uniref:hypothetical protein n=1 Tax=Desulfosporosinus sp. OT TaxID=913865 RepID=UPI0006816BEE|nr:hypothetical protein [Desulfosporosinus sp. OT]